MSGEIVERVERREESHELTVNSLPVDSLFFFPPYLFEKRKWWCCPLSSMCLSFPLRFSTRKKERARSARGFLSTCLLFWGLWKERVTHISLFLPETWGGKSWNHLSYHVFSSLLLSVIHFFLSLTDDDGRRPQFSSLLFSFPFSAPENLEKFPSSFHTQTGASKNWTNFPNTSIVVSVTDVRLM